ncbi:PAS domain-containing protein [Billgrantia endophytica]|uniref:histidine kinase n=1 Tax=Billgrantia endophytica TaxID=2033802 RepID=A0A2N7TXS2_9GAMM|nr:PAS domain-containing protein [Halomonas endophytica]PMR72983.1 sensor protein [Halomonas endophytica]
MIGLLGSLGLTGREGEAGDATRLLDSLNEAVLILDATSRILFANRRWREMGGARAHRLLGRIHPADRDCWHRLRLQVERRVPSAPLTVRVMSASGELRWCEARVQSLHGTDAWPASMTLCDVTAQVRQEQILSASHRSLSQLVNGLPVMIYRARNNRNWSMEYVSEGCRTLTGYAAEALVNQAPISYGEVIHPDDADRVWEQVQDALRRRLDFELHYRIRHAEGHVKFVSEKGHGLYAGNGDVLGVAGVIMDLSGVDYPPR